MTIPGSTLATEELVELSAAIESAASEYLGSHASAKESGHLPDDADARNLWPGLAALDWFRLLVPEEIGGLGLPVAIGAGLMRSCGRFLAPGPLLEHIVIVPLLRAGLMSAPTDPLDKVTDDEWACWLDPGGTLGRSMGSLMLRDGLVNGAVDVAHHAAAATHLILVVGAPGEARVVKVHASDPSVTVTSRIGLTPTHPVGSLKFEAAPGTLLGGLGTGPDLARIRTWIRIMSAAWLVGLTEHVVEITVDHLQQRRQFGRPIGSFQALQHIVADMVADSSSANNLLAFVLTSDSADHDWHRLAIATFAHAATTALRTCELSLQLHGGIGFTSEHELHGYYKSAVVMAGRYGQESDLHMAIARGSLQ